MNMSRRTSNRKTIVVLLILVILAAGLLGSMIWFLNSHVFVGGKAYAKDAQQLDLRDRELSWQEYEQIQAELPDCDITWSVPFQGESYPNNAASVKVRQLTDQELKALSYFENLTDVDAVGCRDYELLERLKEQYPNVNLTYTVSIGGQEYPQDAASVVCHELTDEEIALMAYLPQLRHVDASGCRNYEQIGKLSQAYPELDVAYRVEILGEVFTEADVEATFPDPDVDALMEKLAWLPHMEKVHLVEPSASADALRQLMEAYPDVTFTWDKTVLGKTFNSAETEYDFSNMPLESTDPIEEAMKYFPNAEKVIMSDCGIDNETMAAFREKMRPEYKVVWTVYITKKPVRTDQEVIHSSAYKVCFIDEQSQDLKYCEDAIVVDIGHSYVKDISWVKGMPKLKYLILTHNWVKDLAPLSTCKNLVYLELYWNDWNYDDFTPLLGCTALEDLNVSGTNFDMEPLKQMTWLKNLWANLNGVTPEEHAELQAALPNTKVVTQEWKHTGGGWREVQGYFDMRDIMGLPYNDW